jgi:hypothetical protein
MHNAAAADEVDAFGMQQAGRQEVELYLMLVAVSQY